MFKPGTRRGRCARRRWLSSSLPAAFLLPLVLGQPPGRAEDPSTRVVRVEEDWELVVAAPDAGSVAPQVVCAISPLQHVDYLYATFELNHQSLPKFSPGGLQLQTWTGEWPLTTRKYPNPSVMQTPGETVTWTQAMEVADGTITFEIVNGRSTTWGSFGGQGYLRAVLPINLTDLNAYSPETSVQNSGVSFAGNLVQRLVLKRVRVATADGRSYQDDSPRVVWPAE